MKSFVFCLALLRSVTALSAQNYHAAPDVPESATNPQFPLHVRILVTHWSHINGAYDGYGRGDLLGADPLGFDYTYSCIEPFLHNAQKDEFYQARWKKQDQKLELLMLKVGSDHVDKCELKVAMKNAPYGRYGTTAPATQPKPDGSAPPPPAL